MLLNILNMAQQLQLWKYSFRNYRHVTKGPWRVWSWQSGIFAFLFGKSQRITGVEFEAISKTWLQHGKQEQVANFVQMCQFTEIHFFIRSSKNVFKNQVQKVSE